MEVSEKEIQRYRDMASLIYEEHPNLKESRNAGAKSLIVAIREELPDLDNKTIVTIFASIAYMVSQFLNTPTMALVDILEMTFDHHMLASAAILGAVDLDAGEGSGPSVDEMIKARKERETKRDRQADDDNTGMFL